ncbi:MAG: tyrosine-type recombinase/integrase [Candidatus Brocadiaceae bacterium]|nr:tyrosine-type recombinase/integrase [Candidatus Brocadiaceae bacterium]
MREHAPRRSEKTQKSYASYLKNLKSFFGNKTLSEITSSEISAYKVSRYDTGRKPATINRELAMLSKAFNLAVKEWEWVRENPVSKIPKEREENGRERWLTFGEEKKLLGQCPPWLHDIVVLDLHTGLRQDELLSLTWDKVNLPGKRITIEKTQNTKKSKTRTIPLSNAALEVLIKQNGKKMPGNDLVFFSIAGKKVSADSLRRVFGKSLEKAQIENFTFHDLRHTFATRLAQKGVDIYKISKLLGHASLRMTLRYSHHCPKSLRDAVEVLDVDYNMTTVEEKWKVSIA